MRALRAALLAYYRAAARALPWRGGRDPYTIWISEIMLQQTRVETVRERFGAFLDEFPDIGSLARASEEQVCEAWAGLGYYRRAQNLHRAARVLVGEHGGRWPKSAAGLAELPGIGRYTAGAIASIAFGERVAAVDGNLTRVLARLFAVEGRADEPRLRRRVAELAAELVDGPEPGDLNQALMDLGATVCTPASPRCLSCPVRRFCAAVARGDPARFPGPSRPLARRDLAMAFGWIEDERGVYLRRRPLAGLWAGQWEPPSAAGRGARVTLGRELGVTLGARLARVEHVLTHRRVQATVYDASGATPGGGLVPYRDPLAAPLSVLARKAVAAALVCSRPSSGSVVRRRAPRARRLRSVPRGAP